MMRIFSSIAAFFTLVFAVLGLYDVKDAGDFQNKSWMSEIDGSSYISEISIPGTHDSGALYEPIVPVTKCQEYTIEDQLEMGVRFLDVRVFMIFGSAQISHSVILQGQKFREVTEACLSFLEENPSETIVFSLKGEGSLLSKRTVTDVISEVVSEDESKWFTENRIPTLDEVRGKIVLFNRYDSKSEMGIIASAGWADNTAFEIENSDFVINVQDHYNLGEAENIATKWNEAVELFEKSLSEKDTESNLYINFLSGHTSYRLPDITEVSDAMNGKISDYLTNAEDGNYGIILCDFIDAEICEKIIKTNY